jgi:hypothetical protein
MNPPIVKPHTYPIIQSITSITMMNSKLLVVYDIMPHVLASSH